MHLKFGGSVSANSFLYSALDDSPRARALISLLGEDFQVLYDGLTESAQKVGDFDTLVNVDNALEKSGANASWAARFEERTDEWLNGEDPSDYGFAGLRDMYETVAQHLELDGLGRLEEMEEMISEAEAEEQRQAEKDARSENGLDWANDTSNSNAAKDGDDESRQIDTMFAGLRDLSR
jgi:hypothetical protein